MMDHPDTLIRITVDGVAYLHVPDHVIAQHYNGDGTHVCDMCPNVDGPHACAEFKSHYGIHRGCSSSEPSSFIPLATYVAWRLVGAPDGPP